MMATDCSSRPKDVCQICSQETSYRCLHCAKPVWNKSKTCSVAASEEARACCVDMHSVYKFKTQTLRRETVSYTIGVKAKALAPINARSVLEGG